MVNGARSDHSAEIGRRAVNASAWQFGSVIVQAVMQIAVLAVLSRMVPPEEFGVVGMALIFVTFAKLVADLGLEAALIQRKILRTEHIETAFSAALLSGLGWAAIVWGIAPVWASFFDSPAVESVLQLLSLSFITVNIGVVSSALLWREMAFKSIAIADVLSYAVGYGVVGIALAARGLGPMALGAAVVTQDGLRALLLYVQVRHPLRLRVRLTEFRALFNMGFGMSLMKATNQVALKGDYLIVGRWLGTEALGLYERAYRLMEIPANYLAGVVNKVAFPTMSVIQDDPARLRTIYKNTIGLLALLYLPLVATLIIVAPALIIVLFGPDWIGAVAPFRVMLIGLLFRASYKINDALIRSVGEVYRGFTRIAIYAVLVVGGALAAVPYGIEGVAGAIVVAIFAKYILTAHVCLSVIGLDWMTFTTQHRGGLLIGSVVAVFVLFSDFVAGRLGLGGGLQLALLFTVAAATFAVSMRIMPRQWVGNSPTWFVEKMTVHAPAIPDSLLRWFGGANVFRKRNNE